MIKIQALQGLFATNFGHEIPPKFGQGSFFFVGIPTQGDPLVMVENYCLRLGVSMSFCTNHWFLADFWVVDLWLNLGEIIFGVPPLPQRSRCHAMHGTHATLTLPSAEQSQICQSWPGKYQLNAVPIHVYNIDSIYSTYLGFSFCLIDGFGMEIEPHRTNVWWAPTHNLLTAIQRGVELGCAFPRLVPDR